MDNSPIQVSIGDFLDIDSRFRSWGKKVLGMDYKEKCGYAVEGDFSRGCYLDHGQAFIAASETGSRNYHSYDYALIINVDGELYEFNGKQELRKILNRNKYKIATDKLDQTVESAPFMYGLMATELKEELIEYIREQRFIEKEGDND